MAAHLNADVEDGLTLPPDDLVELPHVNDTTPPLTIETATTPIPALTAKFDPASQPSLFPSDSVPGEIPALKAQFKLIGDHSQHLVDLDAVESTLLRENAVSQESAQLVDDYFGGLFSPRLPKASFTRIPSQTNYAYTVRYAKEVIAEEQPKFVDNYRIGVQEAHNTIQTLLDQYDDIWHRIETGRDDVQHQYQSLIEHILGCPDCIVPIHAESGESVPTTHPQFVNLIDYPIVLFNTNSLRLLIDRKGSPFNDMAFFQAMHAVQHILRSMPLVYQLVARDQTTPTSDVLPDVPTTIGLKEQVKEISLRHVLAFYRSGVTLESVREGVHNLLGEIAVIWEQNLNTVSPTAAATDYQTLQNQFQSQQAQYLTGLDRLDAAADLMHRLMELNQAMSSVLHTLVYFAPDTTA